MSDNDIDRLFKSTLKDAQRTPSPAAWNRLQNELNPEKRKKRGAVWWHMAAAVVLMAIVTIGVRHWKTTMAPLTLAQNDTVKSTQTTKNFDTGADSAIHAKNSALAQGKIENEASDGQKMLEQINELPDTKQVDVMETVSKAAVKQQSTVAVVKKNQTTKQRVGTQAEDSQQQVLTPELEDNTQVDGHENITESTATPAKEQPVANKTNQRKPIVLTYNLGVPSSKQPELGEKSEEMPSSKTASLIDRAKKTANRVNIGKLRAAKSNLLNFKRKKDENSK